LKLLFPGAVAVAVQVLVPGAEAHVNWLVPVATLVCDMVQVRLLPKEPNSAVNVSVPAAMFVNVYVVVPCAPVGHCMSHPRELSLVV
jgi:hypothetical protein